jgi:hypothetical protein
MVNLVNNANRVIKFIKRNLLTRQLQHLLTQIPTLGLAVQPECNIGATMFAFPVVGVRDRSLQYHFPYRNSVLQLSTATLHRNR